MISVVIPALNEEERLYEATTKVIENSHGVPLEILLINDGSTDKTADVIKRLEAEYPFVRSITHEVNRGIGFSFREAIENARYERIAIFSGDNNVTPYLIENLFRNHDKADIIISYPLNTECRGRMRNFLSMLFSMVYIMTFDIHIKYINGNPIYPVRELRKLRLRSRSYSILAEINTKLLRKGLSFYEVEGYVNPNVSKSSALKIKNLLEVIGTYFRLIYEIYFKHRSEYSHRASRVAILEQLKDCYR